MAISDTSPTGIEPSSDIAATVYGESAYFSRHNDFDLDRRLPNNAFELAVLSAVMTISDSSASFASALPIPPLESQEQSRTHNDDHRGHSDNNLERPLETTLASQSFGATDSSVHSGTHYSAYLADIISIDIPSLRESQEGARALTVVHPDSVTAVFEKPSDEMTPTHHPDVATAITGDAKAEFEPHSVSSAQGLDLPSIIDQSEVPNLDSVTVTSHASEVEPPSSFPLLHEVLDQGQDLFDGKGLDANTSEGASGHKPNNNDISTPADHGQKTSDSGSSHFENQTFGHVSAHDIVHNIANDMHAVVHSS